MKKVKENALPLKMGAFQNINESATRYKQLGAVRDPDHFNLLFAATCVFLQSHGLFMKIKGDGWTI